MIWWTLWARICVALLAEGVDRNLLCCHLRRHLLESPSSRRAWIEIGSPCPSHSRRAVALLAEGVDRNNTDEDSFGEEVKVALLAEGVDRNMFRSILSYRRCSRPPRGGRG